MQVSQRQKSATYALLLLCACLGLSQFIDALQEFRILTATASPEYGRSIGSVTTIVTRSGGSHFHGSVYDFFRNDIFDTRNYCSQHVDASAVENFPLREATYIQFRAEMLNIANHADFGGPIADLASPNFGRVLQSGSPLLIQFPVKIVF